MNGKSKKSVKHHSRCLKKNAKHHARCLPQCLSGITELKPEDPFPLANGLLKSCGNAHKFAAEQNEYFTEVVAVRKELKRQNDEKKRRLEVLNSHTKMLKEYLSGRKKITAELDIGAVLDELTEKSMGPQKLMYYNGYLYSSSGELYPADQLVYGENGQVYTLDGELIGRFSLTHLADPSVNPADYRSISIGPGGVVYDQDGQPYDKKDVTFGLDSLVYAHLDNQIIGRYSIAYGVDGMAYNPFGEPVGYKRVKYSPDGIVYSHDGQPYDPKDVTYGLDGIVYGPNGEILGGYTLAYGADGMTYSPTGEALGYKRVRYGQHGMIYGHDGQQYYPREVTYGLDGLVYGPRGDIIGSYNLTYGTDGAIYGPNGEFVGYKAAQTGPDGIICGSDGVTYDPNEVKYGADGLIYGPDDKIIGSYEITYGPDGMGYSPNGEALGYKRVQYRSEGAVVGHSGRVYDVGELRFAHDGLVYGPNNCIVGSHGVKMTGTSQDAIPSPYRHREDEDRDGIEILEEVNISTVPSGTRSSGLLEPEDISPGSSAAHLNRKDDDSAESDMSAVPKLISLRPKDASDTSLSTLGVTPPGAKSGKAKAEIKRIMLLYKMGKAFFSLRKKELKAQESFYGKNVTQAGREEKLPVGPVLLPDGRLAVGHPQLGLIGANTITGIKDSEEIDTINSLTEYACQSFYDHELYTRCDAHDDPVNYNILHITRMTVSDFGFRRSVSSYEDEYHKKIISGAGSNVPP